jgi:diguanylate cyclase (GGDEF)-like protein/PAS domain S-box-containing protein
MLQMPITAPNDANMLAARTPRGSRRRGADDRADALGRTAPWLAGLSAVCAIIVVCTLAGAVSPLWLGGWAALVAATNLLVLRNRGRAAGLDDAAILQSRWACAAEAGVHAAVWSAMPTFAFPAQPVAAQAVLGAALGTMMAGAFLLAVVPAAAATWALVIAGGLLWSLQANGGGALASGIALLSIYAAVVVIGCLTIERLVARQATTVTDERARRKAIALLLKEYEDQGAGWLWHTDANHQLTYASPRLCERLGRSSAQLLGQSLPALLGCDGALGRSLGTRLAFTAIEVPVPTAAGGEGWIALSASPIIDADGAFDGYCGLGVDVTETRRAQERIRRVALVDDLTGLPNRQQMRTLLGEAITAAGRRGGRCALLYADLDGFKPVNDRYGHAAGDAVLRGVAARLADAVGGEGQVGRFGGDEFAIVLPCGEGRQQVEQLGERLIAAVAEPIPFDGGEAHIGLSLGCVFAPPNGATVDELLGKADIALYQAKSKGRGRIALFDQAMQRDAEERALIELDLRHALARNEFRLEYQPVIDTGSQSIVAFEALLRWTHPARGLVPPSIFVPIAEECGLIGGIGEWVIRTACADAATWPDPVSVSVNISSPQLAMPGLCSAVSEAIVASRLQPGRLELEVTESVFHGDSTAALDTLRRLRALGVGIALDNFGSGYASLSYLNRTIFHTLKLDGSFVRDAAYRSETLSVIRAIVSLALSFRMEVTAEGIESFEDFARMKELGCKRVQGYLFGRPTPYAEATALLGAARLRAVG